MRKWMVILSVFFPISIGLAQGTMSDINRIKRDKAYLYGEATLDSREAAVKLAAELLENEVKNWADTMHLQRAALQLQPDTIFLERHKMVRAFLYVKKEQLKKGPAPTPGKTTGPEPAPQPKPVTTTETNPVMTRLMEAKSFYDLEKLIKPLKAEGKITAYGKYTTMTEPEKCFLIVYDQQANIKAFLGKGTTTRRNLKTNQDDSEKNYHGCGAIWVKTEN